MDLKIKYQTMYRANLRAPEKPGKYYPIIRHNGHAEIRYIAEDIAKQSALSTMDIISVIEGFLQALPAILATGFIINLGDFGRFVLQTKTSGEELEEDVNSSNILRVNPRFIPGPEFKAKMHRIRFQRRPVEETRPPFLDGTASDPPAET